MSELSAQQRHRRIIETVLGIPHGEVRSYAEVARAAGLPRGARQVVAALKSAEQDIPWHRVIRADGRIAFPPGSAPFREQQRKLRAEGLTVKNGRVERAKPAAASSLDALLWAPPTSARRRR